MTRISFIPSNLKTPPVDLSTHFEKILTEIDTSANAGLPEHVEKLIVTATRMMILLGEATSEERISYFAAKKVLSLQNGIAEKFSNMKFSADIGSGAGVENDLRDAQNYAEKLGISLTAEQKELAATYLTSAHTKSLERNLKGLERSAQEGAPGEVQSALRSIHDSAKILNKEFSPDELAHFEALRARALENGIVRCLESAQKNAVQHRPSNVASDVGSARAYAKELGRDLTERQENDIFDYYSQASSQAYKYQSTVDKEKGVQILHQRQVKRCFHELLTFGAKENVITNQTIIDRLKASIDSGEPFSLPDTQLFQSCWNRVKENIEFAAVQSVTMRGDKFKFSPRQNPPHIIPPTLSGIEQHPVEAFKAITFASKVDEKLQTTILREDLHRNYWNRGRDFFIALRKASLQMSGLSAVAMPVLFGLRSLEYLSVTDARIMIPAAICACVGSIFLAISSGKAADRCTDAMYSIDVRRTRSIQPD